VIRLIVHVAAWAGLALLAYCSFIAFVLWLGGQAEKLGNNEWNNFK
jgi:hypothetical protein